MRSHIVRTLSVAAAAIALASSAQAQGKGHGRDRDRDKPDDHREQRDRDRDDRDDHRAGAVRRANGDIYVDRRGFVPPGLAKKPGQMPPGQYKKRYTTRQGADVLGGIFRRNGYTVQRVSPYGD